MVIVSGIIYTYGGRIKKLNKQYLVLNVFCPNEGANRDTIAHEFVACTHIVC